MSMKSHLLSRSSQIRFVVAVVLSSLLLSCSTPVKPVVAGEPVQELTFAEPAVNAPDMQNRPYVVLVSIDGYRHDYNARFNPPNLTALEHAGAAAKSLKPIYPSKTFPNHYAIVTGLYGDHNGIVSNEFFDPSRNEIYKVGDRKSVEDGTWYMGEPVWTTIAKQGLRTASYFWVGSEADIRGRHPNYYFRYSEQVPNSARVDRVLEWLKLPPETRPHFITLYFSDVDTAGHHAGPKSELIRNAVMKVDEQIGRLRDGIHAGGLPVNIIVVSDHGMESLDPLKVLTLDESGEVKTLLSKFRVLGRGPEMQIYLNANEKPALISKLKTALLNWAKIGRKPVRILSGAQLKKLHYFGLPRIGDLVIVPDIGWSVGLKGSAPDTVGGNHGWDPSAESMHGIFYAEGPAFKPGILLPTFENVNVVPLICEILGVKPARGIDGRLSVTQEALVSTKK